MMDTSPDPRPSAPAATPVVVVGAGMVGTCTALALRQRGHAVCLLDRRPPGLETSFGNAGLIQCEAAEPYAFPRDLRKLRDVALGRGFDIHWHASGLSRYGAALWRYFRTSAPAAHARVVPHYAALIAQALSAHEALIALSGAQDLLAIAASTAVPGRWTRRPAMPSGYGPTGGCKAGWKTRPSWPRPSRA